MLNYIDLQQVDLNLVLQSGSTVKVDNLIIKPYTLEEIKDYGYTNYMKNLQWISVTIDDFIESILDIEKRVVLEQQRANLKTFDFYSTLGGQELLESLMDALAMIFRTDDVRMLDENVIAINFVKMGIIYYDEYGEMAVDEEWLKTFNEEELTVIHRDNFDNVVEVVKLQNFLMNPNKKNEPETNPADEETRKLLEEMERNRRKVEAKKKAQNKSDEDDTDISDIISAVSSKSNSLNKLNIWNLTLFQLYDEYSRLELIDNYDFSIRAMMAGAEKVDLRHWSSRL